MKGKEKMPKHCPLAGWKLPNTWKPGDSCVFNLNNINCECCFPAVMIQTPKVHCNCPEINYCAADYTHCNVFSEWFWRGKYQNKFNVSRKRTPIGPKMRHEVFKRDKYRCKECGSTNKEGALHVDHIIPVSQGGMDELSNLQTLCSNCNIAKSNKAFKGGEQ